MLQTPDREPSQQDGFLTRLRVEGKHILRLCWGLFWKVTAWATAALFLLFVTLHNDDFRELSAQTLFGAVVVFGYCLFNAACAGIAAVVFAVSWRFWGAWILLPLLGGLLGAVGLLGIGIALLGWLDLLPARAGVHGGGDILALVMLGCAAIIAAIGAVMGGTLLAVLLGLSRRGVRRTVPLVTESAKLMEAIEPSAAPGHGGR